MKALRPLLDRTGWVLLAGSILSAAGCASSGDPTHAQRRAAAGAVTGAILGGIIGHQSGERDAGIAVGAAAGAIAGGVSGAAEDRRVAELQYQRRIAEEAYNRRVAEADAQRQRLISQGKSVEDPDLLAAKQRAEAAEAELARLKKEEALAIQKARQMAEYRAREEAAQAEIAKMRGGS